MLLNHLKNQGTFGQVSFSKHVIDVLRHLKKKNSLLYKNNSNQNVIYFPSSLLQTWKGFVSWNVQIVKCRPPEAWDKRCVRSRTFED